MKIRSLILLGAAVFLWALLTHAPAASVNAWFAGKLGPVALYGVEGSIADGRTQSLHYNGRPLLQNLRWSFQPWWLPALRLSFYVDGGNADLNLKGRVARVFGGVNLAGLQGGGGLKNVLGMAGYPFLPVDGQARFDIDTLKIRNNFPSAASGIVELRGVNFALGKDPLLFGDFKATLTTARQATPAAPGAPVPDGEVIRAEIATLGGPLMCDGEAHLNPDRSYDYDLRVKAKDNADEGLRNMIAGGGLGAPDSQGYYHMRGRGNLGGPPLPAQPQPAGLPPPQRAPARGVPPPGQPPRAQSDPNTSVTGLPVD